MNGNEHEREPKHNPDLDLLKSLLGGPDKGEEETSASDPQEEDQDFWDQTASEGGVSRSSGLSVNKEKFPNEVTLSGGEMGGGSSSPAKSSAGSGQQTPAVAVDHEKGHLKATPPVTAAPQQHRSKRNRRAQSAKSRRQPSRPDESRPEQNDTLYIDLGSLDAESENDEDNVSKTKGAALHSDTKHQRRRPSSSPSHYHRSSRISDNQQVLYQKYNELKELLMDPDCDQNIAVDRQLLREARLKLKQHRHKQQGVVPGSRFTAHPPHGHTVPLTRRQRRHFHYHHAVNSHATQTPGDTVVIDLTTPDGTGRHVSFASQRSSISSASTASREHDTQSAQQECARRTVQQNTHTRQMYRNISSKKERRDSCSDTSKQLLKHDNGQQSKNTQSQSVSTPESQISNYAASEIESTSCNPTRSEKAHALDDNVKNTDNKKIKDWLKKKNKLLRKQKSEQRKLERAKRAQEDKEKEEKEARKAQSAVAVKAWMKSKKHDDRLLKKREQEVNRGRLATEKMHVKGNVINVEAEDDKEKSNTADDNTSPQDHKEINCHEGNDERASAPTKCTCGFVQAMKLTKEQDRSRRHKSATARLDQPDYTKKKKVPTATLR